MSLHMTPSPEVQRQERRERTARYWSRWAIIVAVWGAVALMAGLAFGLPFPEPIQWPEPCYPTGC